MMLLNDIYYFWSEISLWHIFGVFLLGYFIYYLIEVVKQPILAVDDGPFKKYLLENVPTLQHRFWPTIWCSDSRAQTIFGSLFRQKLLTKLCFRRELFTLKDGGEVGLDWTEHNCIDDSPVILILPGLTGDSQAEYINCMVKSAKKIGARVVVFNNRGQGGVDLKTPRLYCASNVEDLAEIAQHIKKLYTKSKIGAIGVSMGSLLLGNYLAEHSEEARNIFTACHIISSPYDVQKVAESIEKPYLNSILDKFLTSRLCETLSKYEILHKSQPDIDFDIILKSKTIREFDSNFTSKHFGYNDVEHYYSVASLHKKLNKISVPFLCLSAADDPFQPYESIPTRAAEQSSHVAIVVAARGGHIGFMEGFWPRINDEYMGRIFKQFFGSTLFDDKFNQVTEEMLQTYQRKNIH